MAHLLFLSLSLLACETQDSSSEPAAIELTPSAPDRSDIAERSGVIVVGMMAMAPEGEGDADLGLARWTQAMTSVSAQPGYVAAGLYRTTIEGAQWSTISLVGWESIEQMSAAVATGVVSSGVNPNLSAADPQAMARLKTGQYGIYKVYGAGTQPELGSFVAFLGFSYSKGGEANVKKHLERFIELDTSASGWKQAVVLERLGGDPEYDLIVLTAWKDEASQVYSYQRTELRTLLTDAVADGVEPQALQFMERIAP